MNFFIYLLTEGLSKIIPFITILVVAKFIDVELFGELTIYFIVFELLIILISNNITATTRIDYFKLDKSEYVKSKSTHLIVSFLIFTLVLMLGVLVSSISYLLFFILALSSLLRTVSYYNLSNLQCKEDAKSYGISNFIYLIFMNILFITMITLDYGIDSWFYSILFGALAQFLYSISHISKSSLLIFNKDIIFNTQNLIKEWKYGLIFIPQAIGFWIKLGIDRVLLANFTSTLIVGYYMFAFQLSWTIIVLSTAINLYITPKINFMLKNDDFIAIKLLLSKFSFLIVFFSIVIFILSNYIINNFYYEKYYFSLDYLPYIIVSISFQSMMMLYLNIFYYIDKKEFVSKFIFITATIQGACAYMSIYFFEVYGLLVFNLGFSLMIFLFVLNKFNAVGCDEN